MSLLKKIGVLAVNVIGVVSGVGILVPSPVGHKTGFETALDIFQEVIAAIFTIEQIGVALGMKGADKLKAAIPLMGQIFGRSVLVRTHGIKDQVLYEKAMVGFAQAGVDLLNSLDSKKVKTEELTS